jgi:hypothetical protein
LWDRTWRLNVELRHALSDPWRGAAGIREISAASATKLLIRKWNRQPSKQAVGRDSYLNIEALLCSPNDASLSDSTQDSANAIAGSVTVINGAVLGSALSGRRRRRIQPVDATD